MDAKRSHRNSDTCPAVLAFCQINFYYRLSDFAVNANGETKEKKTRRIDNHSIWYRDRCFGYVSKCSSGILWWPLRNGLGRLFSILVLTSYDQFEIPKFPILLSSGNKSHRFSSASIYFTHHLICERLCFGSDR